MRKTRRRPQIKGTEASYDDMVILVPVSCSIFFRLRPSFPINLPTKLLCTSIFSGISSVLRETDRSRVRHTATVSPISCRNVYAQLCVDGLLLHDLHDGPAGVRGTFRCGVNCDGLLCCTGIFLPVDVDPGAKIFFFFFFKKNIFRSREDSSG